MYYIVLYDFFPHVWIAETGLLTKSVPLDSFIIWFLLWYVVFCPIFFTFATIVLIIVSAPAVSCKTLGKHNIIHLTGSNGSITLLEPSNNRSCTWIITVPEGNVVKFKIAYYDLTNSILEVRNGQNISSELLESFTGSAYSQPAVFSSGRHLWARFQSIHEKYAMFAAQFEAVNQSKEKKIHLGSSFLHGLTRTKSNLK